MAAVAERLVAAVLATAQKGLAGLGDLEPDRREVGALVGTVAERLAFRTAAGAPPVCAGLEFLLVRSFLGNLRICHNGSAFGKDNNALSKPSPLLQIKDLRRLSLGPLSLDVDGGDCVCITGSSGSGKSQLLRAVADLDPHGGQVRLAGQSCLAMPAHQWRSNVGLLPPESSWWLPGVLEHFHDGMPVPLEQVGLGVEILDQPVAQLSSGERQRLALLRLLSNRPRVLLLDEPTANLDPENTRRVEAVIAMYRREREAAVLWTSHDTAQVQRVANRWFELTGGRLEERMLERAPWLH
jgi:ABC-type iron transport system FetAB ATPase subunit